jgi:ABC-type uncharacterized transport system substrate-binding protein
MRKLWWIYALFGTVIGLCLNGSKAVAHPHVQVEASASLLFSGTGQVIGLQHHWQFDEAYSAFAVQGLDANGDGKISRAELADLAKENTESLSEFDYFTKLKIDGKKLDFANPVDYWLEYDNGKLTLHFTLPLKVPAKIARTSGIELYDPTYFVAFTFREGDQAFSLKSGPSGCVATITRPKAPTQTSQNLNESFFNTLSAKGDFGAQYANRVLVACP